MDEKQLEKLVKEALVEVIGSKNGLQGLVTAIKNIDNALWDLDSPTGKSDDGNDARKARDILFDIIDRNGYQIAGSHTYMLKKKPEGGGYHPDVDFE